MNGNTSPWPTRGGYYRQSFRKSISRTITLQSWPCWCKTPVAMNLTTRARIHCRHEHETRWEADGESRACNRHTPVLKRLTHHFQHVALKLRQFVEKQYPVVPKRHFAGPRNRASSDQPRVANRVMRRAKWS